MSRASAILAAVGGGAALLAGAALWFRFGDAIYFDTLAAGIAGCLL